MRLISKKSRNMEVQHENETKTKDGNMSENKNDHKCTERK